MMGKIARMMKTWWFLALLLTLALSLTSCSSRNRPYGYHSGGRSTCSGSIGTFSVYVEPSAGDANMYQVLIIPEQLSAPEGGDVATVTIANSALGYKTLVSNVVLDYGIEISAYITTAEWEAYDILAITEPYEPSVGFVDSESEKDAYCTLPGPGDSIPAEEENYY